MNQPIRVLRNQDGSLNLKNGKKQHSVELNYGFNLMNTSSTRAQRRFPLQKQARNPFFGINTSSKYVQIIFNDKKVKVIDHFAFIKNRI